MANEEHIKILEKGSAAWNGWGEENPDFEPDLSNANLVGKDLRDYVFSYSNLMGADLRYANLSGADLSYADLRGAHLNETNLGCENGITDLKHAKLCGAFMTGANLTKADLSGALLMNADLIGAHLLETDLTNADLTGCKIYGISAWNLKLDGSKQENLVITPQNEPVITCDNLEVAQFIYLMNLMANNEKIRNAIDNITSRVVLILGRFGIPERKAVLDAIRNQLHHQKNKYIPVVFDFEKPSSRDLTETITLLAWMSRFIIADITEPKSIPQELQAIVPDLLVPVQPLILEGSEGEYSMFKDLRRRYHWVLPIHYYRDLTHLLESLEYNVIAPAEMKLEEIKIKD